MNVTITNEYEKICEESRIRGIIRLIKATKNIILESKKEWDNNIYHEMAYHLGCDKKQLYNLMRYKLKLIDMANRSRTPTIDNTECYFYTRDTLRLLAIILYHNNTDSLLSYIIKKIERSIKSKRWNYLRSLYTLTLTNNDHVELIKIDRAWNAKIINKKLENKTIGDYYEQEESRFNPKIYYCHMGDHVEDKIRYQFDNGAKDLIIISEIEPHNIYDIEIKQCANGAISIENET